MLGRALQAWVGAAKWRHRRGGEGAPYLQRQTPLTVLTRW